MTELSLVSVVLFIASGTLVFCLLFLLAKRQIARFSFKSARRPHIYVGYDIPKTMKAEIQRRFDRVQYIKYEPVLLTEKLQQISSTVRNNYQYRMKALDAFTNAIECLMTQDKSIVFRNPNETMHHYLSSLCPSSINKASESAVISQFSQSYDQARHSPGEYKEDEFITYMELLDTVIRMLKADRVNRVNKNKWKSGITTDTEVIFKRGKHGSSDETKILKSSSYSSVSEVPKAKPRMRTRTDPIEHVALVENKSSGYSSTDRSSSSRSSAEKLLPLSFISDKDESV